MGCGETNYLIKPNGTKEKYETNQSISRTDEILTFSNNYIICENIEMTRKSICKIKYSFDSNEYYGTGFFINYDSYKFLITNYHVLSEEKIKIEIEIWNKSIIKFNLKDRHIIYLPKPKDITIVSLRNKEIDEIEFLFFDLNYIIGYKDYLNKEILSLGYPKGEKLAAGAGIIKELVDEYEFYHNIPTLYGSSGSPIILSNSLKVIGIHKESDCKKSLNVGTFIGEAIKAINEKKVNEFAMLDNFYLYYSQLFNDLKELDNLMKRQIDSFKKYNDYVIISKTNYNYLTKLFENNIIFFGSDIIDSYEKITPITNYKTGSFTLKYF